MTTFYDEEQIAIVEQAINYLLSDRGRHELRKAAEESNELADKFRRMRLVTDELLNRPFTI